MKRSIVLFFVPFLIFAYAFFIVTQKACGDFGMEVRAEKNLIFNHRTHVKGQDISCETCHGFYENGRFKGIPTIATCKSCHGLNNPQAADYDPRAPMRVPHLEMFKDTDRPWSSYVKQPGLVYFSHQVVMGAKWKDGGRKMECHTCHYDKADMEDATVKVSGKMPMGQCMDCHDSLRISNTCMVCHD